MKKILLVLIVILCSGCDLDYSLEINDELIKEMLSIKHTVENEEEYIDDTSLSLLLKNGSSLNYPIYYNDENFDYYVNAPINDTSLYEVYYSNNILAFSSDFSINNYYRSYLVDSCTSVTVSKTDSMIKLNSESIHKCYEKYDLLENLTINIEINEHVVYNNADIVDGNNYIWEFNSDSGYKSVTIYYDLEESIDNEENLDNEEDLNDDDYYQDNEDNEDNSDNYIDNSENNSNSNNNIIYFLLIFCAFVIVVVLIVLFKNKIYKFKK